MTTNQQGAPMTTQQTKITQLTTLGYTHVAGITGRNTVIMTKNTTNGRHTAYIKNTGWTYYGENR
jgi:hypothetical protein